MLAQDTVVPEYFAARPHMEGAGFAGNDASFSKNYDQSYDNAAVREVLSPTGARRMGFRFDCKADGLSVKEVDATLPAAEAGLQPHDFVVNVGSTPNELLAIARSSLSCPALSAQPVRNILFVYDQHNRIGIPSTIALLQTASPVWLRVVR
eukprot:471729-Rhodomonas_salina.1